MPPRRVGQNSSPEADPGRDKLHPHLFCLELTLCTALGGSTSVSGITARRIYSCIWDSRVPGSANLPTLLRQPFCKSNGRHWLRSRNEQALKEDARLAPSTMRLKVYGRTDLLRLSCLQMATVASTRHRNSKYHSAKRRTESAEHLAPWPSVPVLDKTLHGARFSCN
jgi:hypothetical protein